MPDVSAGRLLIRDLAEKNGTYTANAEFWIGDWTLPALHATDGVLELVCKIRMQAPALPVLLTKYLNTVAIQQILLDGDTAWVDRSDVDIIGSSFTHQNDQFYNPISLGLTSQTNAQHPSTTGFVPADPVRIQYKLSVPASGGSGWWQISKFEATFK